MTGHFAIRKAGFIGFDHIFNELERISEHALDHYPPHNIVKYDDDTLSEYIVGKISVLSMVDPDTYVDDVGFRSKIENTFYVVRDDE